MICRHTVKMGGGLTAVLILAGGCSWDIPCGGDGDLVDEINAYRQEEELPEIAFSPSLQVVAEAHIMDLSDNDPVSGECNLHSWSESGDWSGCCYTDDHAEASCMWAKPSELTDYTGSGYEVSATNSGCITAESALEQWKRSPGHNEVILNEGQWASREWRAVGAAFSGNYAVAWFGEDADTTD